MKVKKQTNEIKAEFLTIWNRLDVLTVTANNEEYSTGIGEARDLRARQPRDSYSPKPPQFFSISRVFHRRLRTFVFQ